MFKIGDKIFYPMQGGGVISSIEEKEVFGEIQSYYVVDILHKNLQVMVPTNNTEKSKMRPIVDPKKLDDVLNSLHDGGTDILLNDNQRHKNNLNKIKSGDISETAEVIRDLVRIRNKKKLGIADANMLDSARQILISEVVLVKEIPQEQAVDLVDQIINM
ncbi:Hypothetical protein LUCI_3706 [Lucifera butyrica]|uniref:CarD-like/TRCF RNAP-interacting domain-containing protein n=1 Tax=Lucifera butyrica TaxID=1351585 RepID=A0A498RA71_9FIRM|nr:CarD family transcriptional regulator [Lucifera butyrica]VBB08434.1 Hypothetical protein LUCI_3706 [Lucifera butyrica]